MAEENRRLSLPPPYQESNNQNLRENLSEQERLVLDLSELRALTNILRMEIRIFHSMIDAVHELANTVTNIVEHFSALSNVIDRILPSSRD